MGFLSKLRGGANGEHGHQSKETNRISWAEGMSRFTDPLSSPKDLDRLKPHTNPNYKDSGDYTDPLSSASGDRHTKPSAWESY